MKVSIIIPAYNEERRIAKTLRGYSSHFDRRVASGDISSYELLVVINGTTDKTKEVVRVIQKENKNIKYLFFRRGGKGFAVLEGFKDALARGISFIGFVDADMATPPENFYDLIRAVRGLDIAIASRHVPGARVKTSFKRRVFSKGFSSVVKVILGLPFNDTQCGAKVFSIRAINSILRNPPASQWAFDVELLFNLVQDGFRVVEVPTVWEDKAGGSISLFSTPIQMFSSVVRLRLVNSPFHGFVKLYDRLPELLKVHHRW